MITWVLIKEVDVNFIYLKNCFMNICEAKEDYLKYYDKTLFLTSYLKDLESAIIKHIGRPL